MKKPGYPIEIVTALFLGLGLFAFFFGCQKPPQGSSRQTNLSNELPVTNIVAIDCSGSTKNMRDVQLLALKAAFVRAGDWGEEVAIYAVDRETNCLFPPTPIESESPPPGDVLRQLQTFDDKQSTRTRPALFWKEMEEKYAKQNRTIRILYLTDGDNDWQEEDRLIDKSIGNLAKNAHINVALLGLNADAYKKIEKQFSPFSNRVTYSIGKDKPAISAGISKWREQR